MGRGGRLAALRRPSVGGVSSGSDNDSNSDSEGLRHVMGGRQLLMTLERSPLHRSRSGWLLFRERSPVGGGGGGGGGWGGAGVGYRLLINDFTAVRVDMKDHIFTHDILGEDKTTHNLEMTAGVSLYF